MALLLALNEAEAQAEARRDSTELGWKFAELPRPGYNLTKPV